MYYSTNMENKKNWERRTGRTWPEPELPHRKRRVTRPFVFVKMAKRMVRENPWLH